MLSEDHESAARAWPRRLACVPGLGLDERAWRPTLTALPDGSSRVHLLPGYGVRPQPGDPLGPEELGRRLAESLGSDSCVLVGHSASCQVVAHAAAASDAVRSVVMVGPTTDPRARTWPRLVGRWLQTAAHERPGQVPLLARTYVRTGPAHLLHTMDRARRDDLLVTLARLRVPVHVVRGRRDRICRLDWAEAVVAASPTGSTLTTLARGAHMVPLMHARDLAAALTALPLTAE